MALELRPSHGTAVCLTGLVCSKSHHYIKNTKQERRTAQAQKVISIQRQRTVAAPTIGAGLKQAALN
jgi:hypothetical protein